MDTAPPWPQNIGVVNKLQVMESNTTTTATTTATRPPHVVERKVRPQRDEALNCPRCNSSNTKFCYYNNYSLSQPRYFCKTCRRYWTEGGSLRNVPVGGGSRKNKKASKNNVGNIPDPSPSMIQPQIPKSSSNQGQDLNLGYPLPIPIINNSSLSNGIGVIPSSASQFGNPIGELSLSSGGNFVPLIAGSGAVEQHAVFSRGFSMQEFMKPNFHFFPMEGIKPPSDKNGDNDQIEGNNSNNVVRAEGDSSSGCSWNGMFGGGSPWELGRY